MALVGVLNASLLIHENDKVVADSLMVGKLPTAELILTVRQRRNSQRRGRMIRIIKRKEDPKFKSNL